MNNHVKSIQDEEFVCPDCESRNSRMEVVNDSFDYGTGADVVRLSALTPIVVCEDCAEEFMTEAGAFSRHEAVCRHLGLLTPTELKAARKAKGLSQVGLAELSNLGAASIARWESGQNLPTKANDNYIRLLLAKQVTDNADYIRRHNSGEHSENLATTREDRNIKTLALSDPELQRARLAGEKFNLRRWN
jgi:DNA-binding transcriptional regulator YiaG